MKSIIFLRTASVTTLLACATSSAAIRDLFDAQWIGYDASIYPQGHVSWAMRAADFNGDGLADLAVTGWGGPQLSILLADGEGGYLPAVFYTLSLGSLDLDTADMDGDGDIDLAISNTGGFWEGASFSIWMNVGDGTFFEFGAFLSGQGPTGITVNDFNGDGVRDVAVAHDRYIDCATTVGVILADPFGGFLEPHIVSVGICTYKIDSGDVDGDGDNDLAVAHDSNRVTILYNINGQFLVSAELQGVESTSIQQHPTVQFADVDRDGDLDVLYSHSSSGTNYMGKLALFRNPGDGIFGTPEAIDLPFGTTGSVDVDVADINGDTRPDIIAAQPESNTWTFVPGNGAGGFGPVEMFRAGEAPIAVRAGDVDGDGTIDVAVLARDSMEACVYRNVENEGFFQPAALSMAETTQFHTFSEFATADLENDGDLDLVVGSSAFINGSYTISVRRNNGDGTFAAPEYYPTPVFPLNVLLRDMTGDGFVDLLWTDDDYLGRFRFRRNDGAGHFTTQVNGPAAGDMILGFETADVDADGDLDVVLSTWYFTLKVARNNGGTSFAPLQSMMLDMSIGAISSGDFDHDGRVDLVTNGGVQGWAQFLRGNGNGTFQAPVTLETGRAVIDLATGDFNNDGNLDFAAIFGLDGTGLTVRLGNGDGNFFNSIEYYGSYSAINDTAKAVTLADVDGDGVLDALGAFSAAQEIDFWRGRGDGTFEDKVRYGLGRGPTDLAYGDFDGDGVGDIAASVEGTGFSGSYYPGVILLRGTTAPPSPMGDVDGDGDVDLADLALLLGAFGTCSGDATYNIGADFDANGCVDLADLASLLGNFGT